MPPAALLPAEEGGTQVIVVGPDGWRMCARLKSACAMADKVQMLSGVEAGEQVVTVGGLGLEDGAKVRVRRSARRRRRRRNEHYVSPAAAGEHWTARHAKPVIFVIVTLVAVGIYLANTIPVAVFPSTDFPRVVIGVDNGVAPIDQMLVTVTRPIEEAVNSVQGVELVQSITSRGQVEVDLFFSWKVDMFRTLELVNAALARVQTTLPPTAKVTANRLTFAAFPIMGYSLTSDTIPQTQLVGDGDVRVEAAAEPGERRFHGGGAGRAGAGVRGAARSRPSCSRAAVSVPAMLDAIGRSNMIDSPGLIENRHELVLSLVSGQARTPEEISNIVVKTTPAGAPLRIGDLGMVLPSVKPVYTIVTANQKPAVLLNIYRQPDSNTVAVADAVHAEIDKPPPDACRGAPRCSRSTTSPRL